MPLAAQAIILTCRGALELARRDYYTVGGSGMAGVERRRDSGERTGTEIAFQLCQSPRNSRALKPPKA